MRGSQARRARGCVRRPVLVLGDGSSRRRRPTEASSLNLTFDSAEVDRNAPKPSVRFYVFRRVRVSPTI